MIIGAGTRIRSNEKGIDQKLNVEFEKVCDKCENDNDEGSCTDRKGA